VRDDVKDMERFRKFHAPPFRLYHRFPASQEEAAIAELAGQVEHLAARRRRPARLCEELRLPPGLNV